jgi:hypothetical protein
VLPEPCSTGPRMIYLGRPRSVRLRSANSSEGLRSLDGRSYLRCAALWSKRASGSSARIRVADPVFDCGKTGRDGVLSMVSPGVPTEDHRRKRPALLRRRLPARVLDRGASLGDARGRDGTSVGRGAEGGPKQRARCSSRLPGRDRPRDATSGSLPQRGSIGWALNPGGW